MMYNSQKDFETIEFINEYIEKLEKDGYTTGKISDGHHTFEELYEFRMIYNAALFNLWAQLGIYKVHKSKKHNDGSPCFGGDWFIVVAELPSGQISNHYRLKDWSLFNIPARKKAMAYDGHTPRDVAKRIRDLL